MKNLVNTNWLLNNLSNPKPICPAYIRSTPIKPKPKNDIITKTVTQYSSL